MLQMNSKRTAPKSVMGHRRLCLECTVFLQGFLLDPLQGLERLQRKRGRVATPCNAMQGASSPPTTMLQPEEREGRKAAVAAYTLEDLFTCCGWLGCATSPALSSSPLDPPSFPKIRFSSSAAAGGDGGGGVGATV